MLFFVFVLVSVCGVRITFRSCLSFHHVDSRERVFMMRLPGKGLFQLINRPALFFNSKIAFPLGSCVVQEMGAFVHY